MKKKLLALLLAALMIVSLIPMAVFAAPVDEGYGIILGNGTTIKGQKNEAQTEFLEYVIVADLTAGDTFQLCEFGNEEGVWTETNIDGASTANLKINEDDVYEVTADGKYTIYLKMISFFNNQVYVAYTPQYKYTEYENWQLKHEGSEWQWTENLVKVEEGVFKLADAYWTGSGFNVGSDANPIKKDWFAPEELTLGEEVIAPVTVDVYLKVIDDETVKIGVGVIPKDSAPGGSGSVTAVELTAGELTREDLNTLPADLVTLKSITGCAEDEVRFLTAVYYFYDENKAFVYAGQKNGTEIYWIDSEFEPLSGTPDFDKIKYVKACVYGKRDLEIDDFASNVTVKVNGKDLAMIPVSEECAEGYHCSGNILDIYIVYDLSAHTHNLVKVNGQAATKTAAGFKDYYECKDSTDACHKYFEDATAKAEITDLNAWKAQGGAGYISKLGDKKIITEISLSLTKYTRDNISFTSIPYPEAKITGITEGNEDVELETGYIYFFDKDGKWIYSCLFSGSEAKPVWYDMSTFDPKIEDETNGAKILTTAPDYSKIKKAIVNVMATSKNGFASELKVTVNGKALGVSKMDKGTYNADTMAGYQVMEQDAYFYVPFDIADSTTSPKTGDTSNMTLWLIMMALSSMGLCACLVLGKKRKKEQ